MAVSCFTNYGAWECRLIAGSSTCATFSYTAGSDAPHCLIYTPLSQLYSVAPYCISGSSYSHTSQLAAALSVQSSVPEHISTQTSIIHKKIHNVCVVFGVCETGSWGSNGTPLSYDRPWPYRGSTVALPGPIPTSGSFWSFVNTWEIAGPSHSSRTMKE